MFEPNIKSYPTASNTKLTSLSHVALLYPNIGNVSLINATASLTKNSLFASRISLALLLSSSIPTGSAKSIVSNSANTVCTGSTPSAPDLLPTILFVLSNVPLTLISSTSVEFSTDALTVAVALLNS